MHPINFFKWLNTKIHHICIFIWHKSMHPQSKYTSLQFVLAPMTILKAARFFWTIVFLLDFLQSQLLHAFRFQRCSEEGLLYSESSNPNWPRQPGFIFAWRDETLWLWASVFLYTCSIVQRMRGCCHVARVFAHHCFGQESRSFLLGSFVS